jgi:hypothetical protein
MQVRRLFKAEPITAKRSTFWTAGEFVLTSNSKFYSIKDEPIGDHPVDNDYPPYWRDLKNVEKGGIEIGKLFQLINFQFFQLYELLFSRKPRL